MNQARTTTTPAPARASDEEQGRELESKIRAVQNAALDKALRAARAEGVDVAPALAPLPPTPQVGFPIQPGYNDPIPPQAVTMAIGFFVMCAVMVIGWPLSRAFGKRIERRADMAAVNPAMGEQLQRIERAVDTMAVEIERISESQRFMAKLQNAQSPERAALPTDRS